MTIYQRDNENRRRKRSPGRSASRLFLDAPLTGDEVVIGTREAHYLSHVLRLKTGSDLVVFNGRGQERRATVKTLAKRRPQLSLTDVLTPLPEPTVELVLIQSLIKSDAMDTVVQKATELGVGKIHAVRTDFSVIKLDQERGARRMAHWRKIAQSACEQSQRHYTPTIEVASSLADCIDTLPVDSLRVLFLNGSKLSPATATHTAAKICLAIGPEGGFSPPEIALMADRNFLTVGMGPRILRAETAAIAACSLAQHLWGDLG